jgi:hypothetical protein
MQQWDSYLLAGEKEMFQMPRKLPINFVADIMYRY